MPGQGGTRRRGRAARAATLAGHRSQLQQLIPTRRHRFMMHNRHYPPSWGPRLVALVPARLCRHPRSLHPVHVRHPGASGGGVGSGAVGVVLFGYGATGIAGPALAGLLADPNPARGLQWAVALTAACVLTVGLTQASTLGSRELLLGSLPTLAYTGATLLAVALVLLLVQRPSTTA